MFKIQASNGAIEQHQLKKEVAGLDALLTMKTNMLVAERKLNNKDRVESRYIDRDDARKTYENNRRNYERTCPEKLSPAVQNTMWKRAKQLKDEFVIGMLSQDELHPVKGIEVNGAMQYIVDNEKMASYRSVDRNNDWYKRNEGKLSEYKNIMRHLCPDNPSATDIERFRPRRKSV